MWCTSLSGMATTTVPRSSPSTWMGSASDPVGGTLRRSAADGVELDRRVDEPLPEPGQRQRAASGGASG